jgi:hypothetical protein
MGVSEYKGKISGSLKQEFLNDQYNFQSKPLAWFELVVISLKLLMKVCAILRRE